MHVDQKIEVKYHMTHTSTQLPSAGGNSHPFEGLMLVDS